MTAEAEVALDLRCAAQMRAAGADPIGTAGSYTGYLLVEWARPWPRDMADIAELAPLRRALDGHGVRLQGLVPEHADRRRVILYRRPSGPFAGYRRSERSVAAEPRLDADGARPSDPVELGRRLGEAAVALLAEAAGRPDGTPGPVGAGSAEDAGRARGPATTRDVLVCTHGRRDRCCGSWGTELWQDLAAEPSALGGGTRLWRTSHTGGHRYAATMIVLGEGTAWGFADRDSALRVLHRDGPITDILATYRGCAGLPSPAVQALERAVLAEVGWALLDTPRTGEDGPDGQVALTVDPAGRAERWEGVVRAGRTLPVPDCGAVAGPVGKTTTELLVTDVVRTA